MLFRFPEYGIASEYEPSFNLIWSPDSRQLLLELYSEAAQSSAIVVFEVEKETAFPVMTTDVRILGWMADEGQ